MSKRWGWNPGERFHVRSGKDIANRATPKPRSSFKSRGLQHFYCVSVPAGLAMRVISSEVSSARPSAQTGVSRKLPYRFRFTTVIAAFHKDFTGTPFTELAKESHISSPDIGGSVPSRHPRARSVQSGHSPACTSRLSKNRFP